MWACEAPPPPYRQTVDAALGPGEGRRGPIAADPLERLGSQCAQLGVVGRREDAGQERDAVLGAGSSQRAHLLAELRIACRGRPGSGRPADERIWAARELERTGLDERIDRRERLVSGEGREHPVRVEPVVTGGDERAAPRPAQDLNDPGSADPPAGLVDRPQHGGGGVDRPRRMERRRRRVGLREPDDRRSADVAAALGGTDDVSPEK